MDSTRKGKRIPDALSKTIPIWCATINNAVQECALQRQAKLKQHEVAQAQVQKDAGSHIETTPNIAAAVTSNESVNACENGSESSLLVPSLDTERWDMRYHSLPSQISRSEHAQIADKIPGFAQKLLVTIEKGGEGSCCKLRVCIYPADIFRNCLILYHTSS